MKRFSPIWEKQLIENEILVFTEKDGFISAGLAFDNPQNIVIKDRNGKILIENYDYTIKGNRVFLLNKSLFYYKYEWLLYNNVPPYVKNENSVYNIKGALLVSPQYLRETQFIAQYNCDHTDFPCVIYNGNLKNTRLKIKRKEAFDVVLFGDSISNAANSSWEMGIAGFSHWLDEVKENVIQYSNAEMSITNISRSGYGTEWALSVYKEKINDISADLVIIAFGMNDSNLGSEKFAKNVLEIIKGISCINEKTEFIVISSPLANMNCDAFFGQKEQFDALYGDLYGRITLLNMSAISEFLMRRKEYIEISGNNLNHPNDFFYQFYVSALSEVLLNIEESETLNG